MYSHYILSNTKSPCRVVLLRYELYCTIVSLIDIYETDKTYHTQHLHCFPFVKSYNVGSSAIMSVKNSFWHH